MRKDQEGKANGEVGVELKYCEHCGSLWVRVRGAGRVYCDRCQPKVADLPAAKTKSRRLVLPVRPHTAVEDIEIEIQIEDDDSTDFEAMGGAA
ncbi:MAG TPA: hypothetical protein VNO32_00740 [Candidatus Acidoferrum sp.]|nr:hypothetical protein [Candidatus Acidoferrum sp.]